MNIEAAPEEMLTTRPPSGFNKGKNAFVVFSTPPKFSAITESKSAMPVLPKVIYL